MSQMIFEIFTFMSVTFLLGLFLGWLVWGHGNSPRQALSTEIRFWRRKVDQNLHELWIEQNTIETLRDEKKQLTERLISLEKRLKKS